MEELKSYFDIKEKLFHEAERVAKIWLKARLDVEQLDYFEILDIDEDDIEIKYGSLCRCYMRDCWTEWYEISSDLMFKTKEEIIASAKESKHE